MQENSGKNKQTVNEQERYSQIADSFFLDINKFFLLKKMKEVSHRYGIKFKKENAYKIKRLLGDYYTQSDILSAFDILEMNFRSKR